MTQNYCICNGKRYNTGDIVKVFWYNHLYGRNPCIKEAIFINCDPDKDEYNFQVDGQSFCYTQRLFYRIICKKSEDKNNQKQIQINQKSFADELKIDGLLIAWIWYVFIMAIALIFNDCIFIWIIASIVFFNYRSKKIKKGGYHK